MLLCYMVISQSLLHGVYLCISLVLHGHFSLFFMGCTFVSVLCFMVISVSSSWGVPLYQSCATWSFQYLLHGVYLCISLVLHGHFSLFFMGCTFVSVLNVYLMCGWIRSIHSILIQNQILLEPQGVIIAVICATKRLP